MAALKEWFNRFETVTNGVSPENIYNFDETSFQIGNGNRPIWGFKFPGEPLPDCTPTRTYSEWITTIECVAADGWAADPFMIIQGEDIPEDWPRTKNAPESTIFKSNSSGRITEEISLEWIKFFDLQTKDRVPAAQPRILLFRVEPLHLTFAFLEFCDQNNIIPFCFPLKMGHLMQPFELKHFPNYKKYWKSSLYLPDDCEREKELFIKDFFTLRKDLLRAPAIKDAFAKEGLHPLDSSKILEKLK